MELEFKCPACDSSRFEEVMINVTVISEINSVDKDGDIDYGDQSNHDGEVSHYQCTGCGRPLPVEDVHIEVSLADCLRGMKKDREDDKQKSLLKSIRLAKDHLVDYSDDLKESHHEKALKDVKSLIDELGTIEKEFTESLPSMDLCQPHKRPYIMHGMR